MTDLIDNYGEKTVDEVKAVIESGEYDLDELEEVRSYEFNNAERVTLLRWIDEIIAERADDEGEEIVTVTKPSRGYAAGLWFDSGYTYKQVVHNERIDEALKEGRLELVGEGQ